MTISSDETAHLEGQTLAEETFSDDVRMAVHATNELNIATNATSDDPLERAKALKDFSLVVGPILASKGIATHEF